MIMRVTFSDFVDAFRSHDRMDNFGYDGLVALWEWIESEEESAGEDMELDVVALCCDYTRVESIEEFNDNYGSDCASIEEVEALAGIVIPIEGEDAFIFSAF